MPSTRLRSWLIRTVVPGVSGASACCRVVFVVSGAWASTVGPESGRVRAMTASNSGKCLAERIVRCRPDSGWCATHLAVYDSGAVGRVQLLGERRPDHPAVHGDILGPDLGQAALGARAQVPGSPPMTYRTDRPLGSVTVAVAKSVY